MSCVSNLIDQVLPEPAEAFMREYLPLWNGKDNQDVILHILSYVPIRSFEGQLANKIKITYLLSK